MEEQQRKIKEAMALPPPEDNLEMRAVKAMGAMDNGDEVFGNSDEVNVDSQVVLFIPFSFSILALEIAKRKGWVSGRS